MTAEIIRKTLWVFFISILPVVELRGAIPAAALLDLDWHIAYIASVIGNMLPVPFILLFVRRLLIWMKGTKHLAGAADWIEKHAMKKSDIVGRFEILGLILFVSIPVPGTGAWTGAIIAALLDIRMKYALPALLTGVLIAGVLVSGIAYGFASLI